MLYHILYWTRYVMTWPSISNVRKTFDIVYRDNINMQYQTFYVQYRRHETSISTSLFMTFDIEGPTKVCHLRYRRMWPSISNTFDINIRHRRCKTSISNGHSISKSSISNVTLNIEGPTLDIGVARIQMTSYMILTYDIVYDINLQTYDVVC